MAPRNQAFNQERVPTASIREKQKTDKRDAGELCDSLDRYLRGHDKALSVVRVPTQEQEQKRALIRYHRQIMADRGRCEARAKDCSVPRAPRSKASGGRGTDGWKSRVIPLKTG